MRLKSVAFLLACLAMISCGSDDDCSCPEVLQNDVQVTVTGLINDGLVLQLNGGAELPVGADGSYLFQTQVTAGENYSVSILDQPISPATGPVQECEVVNGDGLACSEDITDIEVKCRPIDCNVDPAEVEDDYFCMVFNETQYVLLTEQVSDDPTHPTGFDPSLRASYDPDGVDTNGVAATVLSIIEGNPEATVLRFANIILDGNNSGEYDSPPTGTGMPQFAYFSNLGSVTYYANVDGEAIGWGSITVDAFGEVGGKISGSIDLMVATGGPGSAAVPVPFKGEFSITRE